MTLVVDIGNTRIKWAQVREGRLVAPGHAVHAGAADRAAAALTNAAATPPNRIVAISVAGDRFGQSLCDLLRARWGVKIEWLAPATAAFGIRSGYTDGRRLGVDRWVALIAAWQLVRGAACVVDAGTTVTFDALDDSGQHLGGLIMPGPRLTAEALASGTRGIGHTELDLSVPEGLGLLGHTTAEAVGHGAMLQVAAAIDRAVGVVRAALPVAPVVVITGGDAPVLRRWLETDTQYRADLVLEGLAYIVTTS